MIMIVIMVLVMIMMTHSSGSLMQFPGSSHWFGENLIEKTFLTFCFVFVIVNIFIFKAPQNNLARKYIMKAANMKMTRMAM